ncbi:Protein ELYS, partial [Leucoagaricus sp. SymC.cos]
TDHAPSPSHLPYFELSNNFAWRGSRPQEIEQRRALLDDLLIYDILLRSGGIRSPDILYPPHDEHSLIRLLEAIENSNYDALKKDCLVYFLLKWHQDGREDRFAAQQCIPPQFAALADAYWHLDSGINLAYGVSILADARLNRDYTSKIIQAISLSQDASRLMRKYVRIAKPPLTEPDDIELYTLALADSSLLEAWQFQRTFHESNEIRPRLLQRILEWCVSPKPRPAALMQLLGLPLSTFEESTLHSYALKPPANLSLDALPLLQDLVCVRLIQLGRYIDAIRMDREFSSSKLGSNTRQAQERSKMVQDLYDALPAIQRTFVDTELAEPMQRTRLQKSVQRSPVGEDVDMAQSWEEIRPNEIQAPVSKLPSSRPIQERANAPRFGGPVPAQSSIPTAPQLPAVFGASATNAGSSRQSFPLPTLPTTFSSPSGSRPLNALSNTAGRLVLSTIPHVSSPLTSAKFPVPPSSQPQKPAGFVSANQQSNAFYTPPARTNRHAQPLFPRVQPQQPANGDAEKLSPKKADDVEMEEEHEAEKVDDNEMDRQPEEPESNQAEPDQELDFSVFGNGLSNWTNNKNKSNLSAAVDEKSSARPLSVKRKVPGSFGDEEDEDMEDSGYHADKPRATEDEAEEPVSSRTTRSRHSISARSTTSRKKAKSKRNDSKDSKRRDSSPYPNLPGGLGSDDGEEEDHIAPLRSTKSSSRRTGAPTSTKPVSRGSTASDLADELGEGVQTRRRSSRLTAASSGSVAVDGDASPKKSARTRKPTAKASSGTRKKRAT